MRIDTLNRKAFEKTTIALEHIEKYYKNRDVRLLENAKNLLIEAIDEDNDYLGAVFYLGMTHDLIGKPADALPYFNMILDEVKDPTIRDEAKYNLAVSYYHRYGHKFLEKAEKLFNEVYTKTSDLLLKYISIANLAQTYAMWMRLSHDQILILKNNEDTEQVFDHIRSKFSSFQECNQNVRKSLKQNTVDRKKAKWYWDRIEATVDNACGMAHMYYTDHLCGNDNDCKEDYLKKAFDFLKSSEKLLPNDWANTCDLGSWNMRFAKILDDNDQREIYYNNAIEKLEKVVKFLRPNYGFALYELGQVYRIKGDFQGAIDYFKKALDIPVKYRDVGDKKIEMQLKMTQDGDTSLEGL